MREQGASFIDKLEGDRLPIVCKSEKSDLTVMFFDLVSSAYKRAHKPYDTKGDHIYSIYSDQFGEDFRRFGLLLLRDLSPRLQQQGRH